MDFNNNKPIYQQIIDLCFTKILSGAWGPDRRVPSLRELAAELTVNNHTVLKAFNYLQSEGIIYLRRGLGLFLAPNAKQHVIQVQREKFFQHTLPELFRTMQLLNISIDEIEAHLHSI